MSLKSIVFGREKSLTDRNLFHSISLIAVFAWVGLGADGLSSSCYGPEETFKAPVSYTHLSGTPSSSTASSTFISPS